MELEAKEETAGVVQTDSFESKFDAAFAEQEKSSVSESKEQQEEVNEEAESSQEDTGADQSKKANSNDDDNAESQVEEKLKKIQEILGDDQKAIDAYIKSKGYHKDPAWQKLLLKSKTPQTNGVDESVLKELEEFKKISQSPDYIRMKMEQQGYKPEAINQKLKELGHEVAEQGNDLVDTILKKYQITPESYAKQDEYIQAKNTISDIVQIAKDVAESILNQNLPKSIEPIGKQLQQIVHKENANLMTQRMKNIVAEEGVLDYDKEIVPAINKFLDENKDLTQDDVWQYFLDINHKLGLEKTKIKGKKAERDENKGNLRSLKEGSNFKPGSTLKKTGNFDKDFDSAWEATGMR